MTKTDQSRLGRFVSSTFIHTYVSSGVQAVIIIIRGGGSRGIIRRRRRFIVVRQRIETAESIFGLKFGMGL
jgi:hypothetical protein